MNISNYLLEDWDGKSIEKSEIYHEMIITLLKLDYIENPSKEGTKNLLALNGEGEIVWIADLPDSSSYGKYTTFSIEGSLLKAWSGSYYCEIDIQNGDIIHKEFVK